MSQLIFDEATMINGNIFKFEDRLQSHVNKYIENGATLVTYYSQDENSSTVDRGLQDIDELFGKKSPLRFSEIKNFPVYGFNQANPENNDDQQIEDINIEGDCVVLPSTIVPRQYDCFIVNHIKMVQLFQVTNVIYDSMKVDGYYKIRYRLYSTSRETIQGIQERLVNAKYYTDLNAIGSNINPIIKEDDYILRGKIQQMIGQMIDAYKALFYNSRHNCFLFRDHDRGMDIFDMCANEFIAKYGLMNYSNSTKVVVLNNKIDNRQFPLRYRNSVYNWIELGSPKRLLRKFEYYLCESNAYPYSSFERWNERVLIIHPLSTNEVGTISNTYSFFDDTQFSCFLDNNAEPYSEYEKLIWKYINRTNLTIQDVSLMTADALLSSMRHIDVFLYTPIIIYIIREILDMK
jgi:hypothetical protein